MAQLKRKLAAGPGETSTSLRVEKIDKTPEQERRVTRILVATLLGVVSACSAGFMLFFLHQDDGLMTSLASLVFYSTAWWALRVTSVTLPSARQTLPYDGQSLRGWMPTQPPIRDDPPQLDKSGSEEERSAAHLAEKTRRLAGGS